MPLYKKFGFDSKLFAQEEFQFAQEMIIASLNDKTSPHEYLFRSNKHTLVSESCRISFWYYMVNSKDRIEHYARPVLDYALDYFFGEWQKRHPVDGKIDADRLKRNMLWVDSFRGSILWATVLGEWDKTKEISKYPDELCMEADFESKEKKAWYILLAIYLREDGIGNASHYVDLIETGKKKREKLLLNVLRMIIAKDAKGFAKEFREYLKFYKSHEYTQRQVSEKLAIDGTIMFNLAKYKGLQVEFPEQYIDHYIHLD